MQICCKVSNFVFVIPIHEAKEDMYILPVVLTKSNTHYVKNKVTENKIYIYF